MMELLQNYDHFVFDLDRTLWECFDKHGNQIWAKQLVPPFSLIREGFLVDDVGNTCMLKDGVKSFMNLLSSHSKLISFISTGGIKDLPPDHQPSLLVLHFFEMLHFFSAERVLLYKSEMKSTSFPKPFENSLFFDDSQECLDDIRNSILGVSVIDSKSIQDYHPQVLLGRLNELIALQKTKD